MRAFRVRDVERADIPEVVRVVAAVLAEFGLTFCDGSETDAELFELPDSYTARRGAFWVVEPAAEVGPRTLVGTAGIAEARGSPVEPGSGTFELRKMYLLPETRGHGVGKALVERALAHARERGARRVVLDTVDGMRDAIGLYERYGFRRDDAWIRASRCTRGYVLEL